MNTQVTAALARYDSDGRLDRSFGDKGIVLTDFPAIGMVWFTELVIDPRGRIVVAGRAEVSGEWQFALARYLPDGQLDTRFNGDGRVLTDFGHIGPASGLRGPLMAIHASGRVVLAGAPRLGGIRRFALARYNQDGSLDTRLGGNGVVLTDFPNALEAVTGDCAIDDRGRIVVAGSAKTAAGWQFALARYAWDGSLDMSFGGTGTAIIDLATAEEYGSGVLIDANDGIVVGGSGSFERGGVRRRALVRYTLDGKPDTSFGDNGQVLTDFPATPHEAINGIALDDDGRIVVAGPATKAGELHFALARYNANGSVDTTFGTNGQVLTDMAASDRETALNVLVDVHGRIVVGGWAGTDDDRRFALARYQPDGSLDRTFGRAGKVLTDVPTASYAAAFDIAVDACGRIIAAGGAVTL